ncbi:MAG: cadherin domain-containing protein [Pirellulaceae bacterium]
MNCARYVVDRRGSDSYDHADWADARLIPQTKLPFTIPAANADFGALEIWRNEVDGSDEAAVLQLNSNSQSSDSIYQDIATQIGDAFILTFDMLVGSESGSSHRIDVLWDGTLVDSFAADNNAEWDTKTVILPRATGALTRLEIRESGEDGLLLDNVHLYAVNNHSEFVISENAMVGTPIGAAIVSEANTGTTFAIVAGNEDDLFAIDVNTGLIRIKQTLDFETQVRHDLTIVASNDAGMQQTTASIIVEDGYDEPAAPIVVEAEDMVLSGDYVVEDRDFASGGSIVAFNGVGTASFTFTGGLGRYDLSLAAFDEIDGFATYRISVNGQQVYSQTMTGVFGSLDRDEASQTTILVKELELNTGDIIEITGIRNLSDKAGLDRVTLEQNLPTTRPAVAARPSEELVDEIFQSLSDFDFADLEI